MTPWPIAIPLVLLTLLSAGALTYWGIAAFRLTMALGKLPTARAGLGKPAPKGRVLVAVPAHNEAGNIEPLIRTLRAQTHPDFRVVLTLDRCTDDTEAVARAAIDGDERFQIVLNESCPDDWAGKVHAVHAGVTRSGWLDDADFVLCTDADCTFEPQALEATTALLEERGLDLLSLFSSLTSDTWFERVVQPAAGFELGRWFPLNRANHESHESPRPPRRPFANGQFLLFRGPRYREFGGHAHPEIRAALLEDIAFARLVAALGHPTGLLLADGVVQCRMYRTWAEFRKGWKRIYTESANRKPERMATAAWQLRSVGLVSLLAWVTLGLAWLVPWDDQPLAGLVWGVPALAILLWIYALGRVLRVTHAPLWLLPLWPIGQFLVASILSEAARDLRTGVPTTWGGRTYARDVR